MSKCKTPFFEFVNDQTGEYKWTNIYSAFLCSSFYMHVIISLPCIFLWILDFLWFGLSFYYCSYFSQILEEHGPLVAEDPLLVGELENFPQVAQLKIQEAGGFESFLLDSLRFIKMGKCIGLAKHAVSLQQAGHGGNLDDLDVLVDPDTNSESPNLHEAAFTRYLNNFSSAETEVYPILPNPYMYDFESASGVTPYVDIIPETHPYSFWSNGHDQQQDPNFVIHHYGNMAQYTYEVDGGGWQMDPSLGGIASLTTEENFMKKHEAVQVNTSILLYLKIN